jgi:hypothetical protein
LLARFNQFLGTDQNSYGLVFMDRIPIGNPYQYMKEKFQIGLTFRNQQPRRLERILGLSHTCDGASHFASLNDILVGAFRYCVNEPERNEAGQAMFPLIARRAARPRSARVWIQPHPGRCSSAGSQAGV